MHAHPRTRCVSAAQQAGSQYLLCKRHHQDNGAQALMEPRPTLPMGSGIAGGPQERSHESQEDCKAHASDYAVLPKTTGGGQSTGRRSCRLATIRSILKCGQSHAQRSSRGRRSVAEFMAWIAGGCARLAERRRARLPAAPSSWGAGGRGAVQAGGRSSTRFQIGKCVE